MRRDGVERDSAPHLRRTVALRSGGRADRPRFSGYRQCAGPARRQTARRALVPGASRRAWACLRAGPPDRPDERGRVHRRRGRGLSPNEFLHRRGRLSRKALRGPESGRGHAPAQGKSRRGGRLHHHADELRQREHTRFYRELPRGGYRRADHSGHQAFFDEGAAHDAAADIPRRSARGAGPRRSRSARRIARCARWASNGP